MNCQRKLLVLQIENDHKYGLKYKIQPQRSISFNPDRELHPLSFHIFEPLSP